MRLSEILGRGSPESEIKALKIEIAKQRVALIDAITAVAEVAMALEELKISNIKHNGTGDISQDTKDRISNARNILLEALKGLSDG